MKVFLLLISSLFVFSFLHGQSNYTITGTIKDSTGQVVIGANVWLMTSVDTIRGVSDVNGTFLISGAKGPDCTLRITSLGFDTWERTMSLNEGLDFQIVMKPNMKMLKEIVVKGKAVPVTFKKDTVEYDASGYMFSEHDMVADLMKRLPGLEVNSDGTISMAGQPVTKIMINGQEFMVSDIKTLTSLIPASLINKIQLIDDYGNVNRMRGVTKGETQKIINLKTSGEIKDIISGRLSTAYGEEGLYRAGASAFKFNDRQQYNFAINNSNIGQYTGKGNNTTIDFGIGQKFSDKLYLNIGGYYKTESTDIVSKSSAETVTSEGSLYNTINSVGSNTIDNNVLKMELRYSPDKDNKYLIHLEGNSQNGKTFNDVSNIQSGFQRKDQISLNSNQNRGNALNGDVFYTHFFKKAGRNIAFSGSGKGKENVMEQDSKNNFRYYGEDTTNYVDSTIHQIINKRINTYESKLEVSYIEPLGDKSTIEFRSGYLNSFSRDDHKTSLEESTGKLIPVDSLSNKFNYRIQQIEEEITWQNKGEILQYWLGANVIPYRLSGPGNIKGISLFPVLQVDFKIAKNSFLKFLYKGNNMYPTYNQLSIVPDYSDLQNPVIGNADLKPGKQHSFTLEYKSSKGNRSVFTNFSFNTVRDNITTNVHLIEDAYGTVKQQTGFINTNGNFSLGNKSGWSTLIGEKKRNSLTIGESVLYATNEQYYNSSLWKVSSFSSNLKVEVNLNIGIFGSAPNVSYNYSRNVFSGSNTAVNIHALNYYAYNILKITPNISFELVCSGQNSFSPLAAFRSNSFILDSKLHFWWFKRTIITSIFVNNALDNKAPISQNVASNTITTTSLNNRGRYFMVNFIYDFRKIK